MQILKESKTTERRQFLKHSVMFLSASVVSQLAGVVRSLALTSIFMPAQLGIWNLMGVIIGYGSNSDLGIFQSICKCIPTLRGQGNVVQIKTVMDSSFWVIMALAGVSGIVLCLWAWFVNPEYSGALQITAIIIFLSTILNYLFCLLRSDNRFSLASQGIVTLGVLSTLLVVLFAFSSSNPVIGALIGLPIAEAIVIVYWFWKGNFRFTLRVHVKTVWNLLLTGFPLITISLLSSVLLSVDRWVLAAKLTGTMLGYYALCIMVSNVTGLVPGSIYSVIYPKILERYGASGNPRALSKLFSRPMRAMGVFMSLLIGSGVLIVPFLIRFFMPKYIPSITPLCILLGASYFYSSSHIPWAVLVAIDKTKYILRIQLVLIPLALILDMVVVSMGWGITGVAWSTSIVYFCYGCVCVFLAAYYVFEKQKDVLLFLGEIVGVFLIMIVVLVLSTAIIPEGLTLRMSSIFLVLRLVLLSLLFFPVLYWSNRDGELVAIVREVLIGVNLLRPAKQPTKSCLC